MKSIFYFTCLLLFFAILPHRIQAQDTNFEGILSSRVTVRGIDFSAFVEKIDYSKSDVQQQVTALFKSIPDSRLSAFQAMLEKDPMLGLVVMMTPPKGTIYVKNNIALVKTKGLGYEIQHYHNEETDEAFLYSSSLIQPEEKVTAFYKPSQGYGELFAAGNHISTEKFTITREANTVNVAGYTCQLSSYTPKPSEPKIQTSSVPAVASVNVRKLVVYTSEQLPKSINFSHPYYLPENTGILRIDVYLENNPEPTLVYEMTSVQKTPIHDNMLVLQKTEPVYPLTDLNYGMKVLGIMMGGMSVFHIDQDEED